MEQIEVLLFHRQLIDSGQRQSIHIDLGLITMQNHIHSLLCYIISLEINQCNTIIIDQCAVHNTLQKNFPFIT